MQVNKKEYFTKDINSYYCLHKISSTAMQPSQLFMPALFRSRDNPAQLSARYSAGSFSLSMSLLELINAKESRVVIYRYQSAWYVAAVKKDGFWLNLTHRNDRVCSATICSKSAVRAIMQEWGFGPGDSVVVPVAKYEVHAVEIGLDPALFPQPFFRLVVEQTMKK